MYAYTVNIELVAWLKMKFLIMMLASENMKQIFSLVMLYIAFCVMAQYKLLCVGVDYSYSHDLDNIIM